MSPAEHESHATNVNLPSGGNFQDWGERMKMVRLGFFHFSAIFLFFVTLLKSNSTHHFGSWHEGMTQDLMRKCFLWIIHEQKQRVCPNVKKTNRKSHSMCCTFIYICIFICLGSIRPQILWTMKTIQIHQISDIRLKSYFQIYSQRWCCVTKQYRLKDIKQY